MTSIRRSMMLSIALLLCIWVAEVCGWRSIASRSNIFRQKYMYDSSARLKMTVNVAGAIVRVQDLEKSKAFYSQALKLPVSSSSGNTADVEVTLGLTLKLEQYEPTASRKEYKRGEGYDGVVLFTPQAKSIIESQPSDIIKKPFDTYKYQASFIPDEDELKFFDTQHGTLNDPDQFHIEIHDNPTVTNPTARLRLYILELKTSLEFYQNVLGMKLLRQRANLLNTPREASLTAYLGQTTEKEGPVLDLVYKYGTEVRVKLGNALEAVMLKSLDMEKTLKRIEIANVDYEMIEGQIHMTDPTGYKVIIV